MRNLVLVLGDQLDRDSVALHGLDPESDAVWMAEVHEEATHVWCHKLRLAFFFSAMRHFRDELQERNIRVLYHELSTQKSRDRGPDFATILKKDVRKLQPEKLQVVLPGDYRVKQQLQIAADECDVPLEILPDQHFLATPEEFAEWARGRKSLLQETFYRYMRKKHNVLMKDGEPVGNRWNYDEDNRDAFDSDGPGCITGPHSFRPDELTGSVCQMVERRFADHPGSLEDFDLPVTHTQAATMLRDFVKRSLPQFGQFEDAMWSDEAFLYHSRLSAPLNVKLLNPRACTGKAVEAWENGDAPLNSVEGFVRQILGWREFIRGIYWLRMPGYAEMNHFGQEADVPSFFWDGDTEMECVRQSMQHVIRYGYAHHIHRLMVLGNLALMLGVHPRKFHDWHMAMYVDAVDWVSLPNALGMSQHGDGGIVGTKPYVSTGNYVNRMSDFCRQCKYNFREAASEQACPFTTLYWDFLDRHYRKLKGNQRMSLQMKHIDKKREKKEMAAISQRADKLRQEWTSSSAQTG
jgi:deoxyribodipyrimidine photolyase-related protein